MERDRLNLFDLDSFSPRIQAKSLQFSKSIPKLLPWSEEMTVSWGAKEREEREWLSGNLGTSTKQSLSFQFIQFRQTRQRCQLVLPRKRWIERPVQYKDSPIDAHGQRRDNGEQRQSLQLFPPPSHFPFLSDPISLLYEGNCSLMRSLIFKVRMSIY